MNTKERIVAAAIDLFAEKGYTETSMRNIADAVDIRASSIYNHFKGKEEIFDLIFKEYIESFLAQRIDMETLEDQDAKTILQELLCIREEINQGQTAKMLKIIMHEQFRETRVHEFIRDEFYQNRYLYIKDILDRLVAAKKINAVRTDLYARLFVAQYVSASIEAMHLDRAANHPVEWKTTNDTVIFLIDQIVNS